MRTFILLTLILAFTNARSEIITTAGGRTETGGFNLLCPNPFLQTGNVDNLSLTDYAEFRLLASLGCNYYLHSTLSSIGAAGTEAGFHIETGNLAGLLSGVTIDTYLDGKWQESASGSALLSLLTGGKGNVAFKTTKAYDALRIRFHGVSVGNWVRIYYGYGDNSDVQTLLFSLQQFKINEALGKVVLQWQLQNNSDIESIEIEKSVDQYKYATIGTISKQNDTYYTYADQVISKAWYRLKAHYKNGQTSYSQVLFYKPGFKSDMTLYPNPANGNLIYVHTQSDPGQTISYIIVDAMGKEMKKGILTNALFIDVSSFKKGVYFIKTNSGQVLQFIK